LGIEVVEKIAVADSREGIRSGLDRSLDKGNIVLITGGLGPTKDDITKKVMAEYFGMEMRFDVPTYDRIQRLFERWGRSTTEAHREQCYMPSGAELIPNKMGTAPGMLFRHEGKVLVSMPGVPYEMKHIMEQKILPLLKREFTTQNIIHHTLLTAGEGESRIADKIESIVEEFPKHISIAYLPNLGSVKLRLTAVGENEGELKSEVLKYASKIESVLGELVFGYGKETLSSTVGKLALEKGLTIGTAESCTGGLVSSKIVKTSGSSAYFQGAVTTYSNELKNRLLGVKLKTLETYGAVSEETVKEMVLGANAHLGVDVSVAISGIAGPGGGSEEKPVGTIWIACGNSSKIDTLKISAGKNREKNIEYASNYALNVLRKFLKAQ
ncbi:MAG: CinA family nicotinamide mononucleotide deamidase-related protein, partial [Saprospiraceae bacterium]|nr:CinA family nicotinamide mononucleotide deamidase-related protein [Saprospiraceae bacterium]